MVTLTLTDFRDSLLFILEVTGVLSGPIVRVSRFLVWKLP